jgi:hypothetical protein
VVLKRGDAVASSWRGRYDRLRLNASRPFSKLPAGPYARGTGIFPSRDEVVSYLDGYAKRHEVAVRHGTRLERIDRSDGACTPVMPDRAARAVQPADVRDEKGMQSQPLMEANCLGVRGYDAHTKVPTPMAVQLATDSVEQGTANALPR